MKLVVFTISLDSMPWLPAIFTSLNALSTDWRWIVAEGASMNGGSTRWCSKQSPRLSMDGTTQLLDLFAKHPRVTVIRNEAWPSKDDQVNACLALIDEECLLLQMDSDEVWQTTNIVKLIEAFERQPHIMRAYLRCRYFVGLDKYCGLGIEDGNSWLRAWRFKPGMLFDRHEPPILAGNVGSCMIAGQTFDRGIIFDHLSWVDREQVKRKAEFYKYKGAVEAWERLQDHTKFPVRLKQFFPWSNAASIVVKT